MSNIERKNLTANVFGVPHWINKKGNETEAIELDQLKGKFKVIFCFQSWCPGCHSVGFPSLQRMVKAMKDNPNVVFLAIQTVFEGFEENTIDKISEMQKKYNLEIPFGHDAGNDDHSSSIFMRNYQTGGTPWFVFIDKDDNIVFADFHLNVDAPIEYLKQV